MKFKLFANELFGGKKKLILFVLLTIIIYILVGVQIVFNTQYSNDNILPDLLFTGQQGETILFDKYGPIDENFANALDIEMKESVKSYSFVERNIITVQKENSLENITYSIFGCEYPFIKEKLYDQLKEGQIPEEEGKFEVIVGGYIAKAFDIKVGDVISRKTINIKNLGDVDIVLDLSGEDQKIEYQVIGILNYTNNVFDYSILLDKSTQKDNSQNVVWSFFTNESSKNIYLDQLVNSETDIFFKHGIGSVSESYRNKNNGFFEQVLKNGYIFVFVIILAVFMVSYLIKGITKKLGIFKALGISNKYIYKSYFNGVALIQLIALLLSFLTMNILTYGMNALVSESYGYDVYIYKANFNSYLLILTMFALVVISMFGIISYKVTKVSPKVAMIS